MSRNGYPSNNNNNNLPPIRDVLGEYLPRQQSQHVQNPYGAFQGANMEPITSSNNPACPVRGARSGSSRPNPHPCDSCDATFPTPSALITHIRSHTGEKPFMCPACGRAFSVASNLNRHMKTHQ